MVFSGNPRFRRGDPSVARNGAGLLEKFDPSRATSRSPLRYLWLEKDIVTLMSNARSRKNIGILLLIVLTSILFKIIPASPNFNPQIVVVLYLGTILSGSVLFFGVLILSIIADLVSAYFFGYPVFGSWTYFTYSAYFLIAFSACFTKLSPKRVYFFIAAITSSIGFWLWTNLGVWLLSGMYQHTAHDFIQCYVLALPFLKSSLWAAVFWSSVFFIGSIRPISSIVTWASLRATRG